MRTLGRLLNGRMLKLAGLSALTVVLCGSQSQCTPQATIESRSGIESKWLDKSVRPQDDLYRATNGKWLASTSIPAHRKSTGAIQDAKDRTQRLMIEMFKNMAASPSSAGTPAQRLGDFYASYMDEARLTTLGTSPLQPTFARIDALGETKDIAALLGYFESVGINTMFSFWISPDRRDASRNALNFISFGTTLNRHVYFDSDARSIELRASLLDYITRILELTGDTQARANAARIAEFERAIAHAQSTGTLPADAPAVVRRSDDTYSFTEIAAFAPFFDWQAYRATSGLAGRADTMYIRAPEVLAALDGLLARTSIDTIRTYLKYLYVNERAQYLSRPFEDAHFALHGKALSGQETLAPRDARGAEVVTHHILDEAGVEYAKRHLTRDQKAYVQAMFSNLKQAYAERISKADWLHANTRQHALLKLEKMTAQLGAPDDSSALYSYSTLVIARGDLFGNVERAEHENHTQRIAQLGRPVDKRQWNLDAFQVSAQYEVGTNQIVVPAGMLQPPFYQPDADDAVNYSGLGLVIGHEISHGFDIGGSKYDANGTQRNWWTEADRKRYEERTQKLVDQFNGYSPLPGYHIDGERTQSENIAEIAGLNAAYRAYQISLGKRTAPLIDGLTGEQRFFHGFAQLHRSKMRDTALIEYIKSDSHAPSEFRVNGTVRNQQGFYDAFNVKPTDKLYLPPDQRFALW
jgi:putative endopeptidase